MQEQEKGTDGVWDIEHKKEKKLVGIIHLMALDMTNRKADIGFVVSKAYWNNGIATEALKGVLDFSFDVLRLHRIQGHCIPDNITAAKVMEKAGMSYEGTLRGFVFQKGNFRDFKVYAILSQDHQEDLPKGGH